jgi:uncharacterized lipoprotein YajG
MKLFTITYAIVSMIVGSSLAIQSVYIYKHFTTPDNPIKVAPVNNRIVMGQLAGNRNLAFGVKNIMEEFLQEEGYDISDDASKEIKIELLYLDVLKTQTNLSVFHRNSDAVVIRMRGQLIEDDKVKKTVIVEESAEEVSMAALVIDDGGKFNQTNLSAALKKSCNTLINKLL